MKVGQAQKLEKKERTLFLFCLENRSKGSSVSSVQIPARDKGGWKKTFLLTFQAVGQEKGKDGT